MESWSSLKQNHSAAVFLYTHNGHGLSPQIRISQIWEIGHHSNISNIISEPSLFTPIKGMVSARKSKSQQIRKTRHHPNILKIIQQPSLFTRTTGKVSALKSNLNKQQPFLSTHTMGTVSLHSTNQSPNK